MSCLRSAASINPFLDGNGYREQVADLKEQAALKHYRLFIYVGHTEFMNRSTELQGSQVNSILFCLFWWLSC